MEIVNAVRLFNSIQCPFNSVQCPFNFQSIRFNFHSMTFNVHSIPFNVHSMSIQFHSMSIELLFIVHSAVIQFHSIRFNSIQRLGVDLGSTRERMGVDLESHFNVPFNECESPFVGVDLGLTKYYSCETTILYTLKVYI